MSNSYQKIYEQGNLNLARSLIIKSEATARATNEQIEREGIATGYKVLWEQPETWRYYKHLAGEYHEVDVPMTIVSLDTALEISFDSVTLKDHRATVRAYSQYGTFYKDLVARFPTQELLIRGILNPVVKTTAIQAPDHTILAWDRTLVEPQEDDFIVVLQQRIQRWFKRWFNSDFTIAHPLYPATALATCIAYWPSFIASIRLENCHTRKVHSFHIWSFLDNYGNFSKYRRAVTTKQALWLYRNIRWLRANAGRKEAFTDLVDVVLTDRYVPLGQYEMKHLVDTIAEELYPQTDLQRTAINETDYNPLVTRSRTVGEVTELQIPLARDNGALLTETKILTERALQRSGVTTLATKVLESEMVDNSQRKPYALNDVLLEHWIFYATYNRYSTVITVRNPNNGDLVRMTSREAVVWWLYGMNRLVGVDLLTASIPNLTLEFVRKRTPPTREELRYSVSPLRVNDDDIDQCLDDVYAIEQIISTETFYYLCTEIHQRMLRHYRQYTAGEESQRRAQLEFMTGLCYRPAECPLVDAPETFASYFQTRGWTLHTLSNDDIRITVEDTVRLVTGADVVNELTLAELQRSLLGLMSSLSAYSNQYLATINSEPAIAFDVTRARLDNLQAEFGDTSYLHMADTTILKTNSSQAGRVRLELSDATTLTVEPEIVPQYVRAETQLGLTNDMWFEDTCVAGTPDVGIRNLVWSN